MNDVGMHYQFPTSFSLALQRHARAEVFPARDSFAAALLRLLDEKRLDGITDASLRGSYIFPGAAVLQRLPAGVLVHNVTFEHVRDCVRQALDDGYAPSTIRKQHLTLIRQVMAEEGVRDVTGRVRRRMRAVLARESLPKQPFSAEELVALFERMARYKGTRALPVRWKHIAAFRLAAHRGVRALEMGRILIRQDIDWDEDVLLIRKAKDPSNPRRIALGPALRDDIVTLCDGRDDGLLVEGGARALNRAVSAWQERLKEPRLTMTNLRRSFASDLDAQGTPVAVMTEAMGHARGSTQVLYYVGTTKRRVAAALTALDHRLSPQRTHGETPTTQETPCD